MLACNRGYTRVISAHRVPDCSSPCSPPGPEVGGRAHVLVSPWGPMFQETTVSVKLPLLVKTFTLK